MALTKTICLITVKQYLACCMAVRKKRIRARTAERRVETEQDRHVER